jgi:hypothetical protein
MGRSGPALAEVAAEMNEIFDQAGLGQPKPNLRRPAAVAALRPSSKNGPTGILLTAAAAGLLGLGAGAFVIRSPGSPAPDAAKLAARSQPHPSQPQPQSPVTPPIALAEAAPAPSEPPPAAKASPPAKGRSTAARSRAEFRHKLARLGEPRSAQARPPIRLGVPAPAVQPASCEQDADGEECRQAVIQADRHLRTVYQNAFRRGVSREVLADYRDRWADLRERNNEDPGQLIESYGALAYELGSETPDDQGSAPRPKSRSGLRALADLLLPWR